MSNDPASHAAKRAVAHGSPAPAELALPGAPVHIEPQGRTMVPTEQYEALKAIEAEHENMKDALRATANLADKCLRLYLDECDKGEAARIAKVHAESRPSVPRAELNMILGIATERLEVVHALVALLGDALPDCGPDCLEHADCECWGTGKELP